jgi:SAM-dependent methyltransferase
MKTLNSCLICRSKNIVNKTKTKDYAYTKEKFVISKCNSCFILFTNTRPDKEKILKYYPLNKYDSYGKSVGFLGYLYKVSQKLNNTYKTKILKKYKKGSLLDYGAGAGSFVEHTNKKGFISVGFEPINKTKKKGIINTNKYLKKKYDWITMWHVLEHIHNPVNKMKELSGLLEKGGHIAVALPNNDSYDNTYYKKYWAGYDVPRHLFHFNRKSFAYFSKDLKLEIIEEKPLFLDSIYVSILSEGYKKRPFSFIFGFFVGLFSNISALITGNYSSIIYILRKC